MKNTETMYKLLKFIKTAEKLKTTLRHSYTNNIARQESSAEHSWLMCIIAISISDQLNLQIDELKMLKMITIHDLAEAITGDIPSFEISERRKNKQKAERRALVFMTKMLNKNTAKEIISLWEEFEERKSIEAKVAQAIDKIEVLIQHNIADINTWEKGDFDTNPYFKNDYYDFNSFFRELKDIVDQQTMEKIEKANLLSRVKPKHLKRYKK